MKENVNKISRREFIRNGALTAGLLSFPTIIPSTVLGKNGVTPPSGKVAIAAIGCGSRAKQALKTYRNSAQVVAAVDPVRERREEYAEMYGCESFNDFRDVLSRDDIDAVHISTGDYWHVPIVIAAARAGKHVYCEKPLGLSIEQDQLARKAVQENNVVFQYGTQNRSTAYTRLGIELVLNGYIGEVKEVVVWCYGHGPGQGKATPVLPVPDGWDYDLWLGPAPEAPFCHDRCLTPAGVYYCSDYAIGFLAGWGAHPLDALQWWADQKDLGIPVEYSGTGKWDPTALYDTVYTWDMKGKYANGLNMKFFENRNLEKYGRQYPEIFNVVKPGKVSHGTVFIGEKGWVYVSRQSMYTSSPELREKARSLDEEYLVKSTNHSLNFAEAVKGQGDTVTNIESSVRSDTISHLCNISILNNRPVKWDPQNETIIGDEQAARMMIRKARAPYDQLLEV